MVIGNYLGYGSVGTAYLRPPAREALTLEAKVNPQAPNEYSVHLPAEIFKLKPEPMEMDYSASKPYQNRDPVSQTFLAVAEYQSAPHQIDIFV